MSETIRRLVSQRKEDIQGIIMVALTSRSPGGETVVTEEELEAAAKDRGVYMTILKKGIRIEALSSEEVRERSNQSVEAGGNNKPKEEKNESKKPETK